MKIQVLAEDENLLAVLKPCGVHSAPMPKSDTLPQNESNEIVLAAEVMDQYPDVAKVSGHKINEGGLLHRLDYGTSGILLFAKNQTAFDEAKRAWSEQKISKIYLTWVSGDFDISHSLTYGKDIQVSVLLGHDEKSKKRMRAASLKDQRGIRGTPQKTVTSISELHVLNEGPTTLLGIALHTGVMHQIRAVLSAMGHPILGDETYASRRAAPHSFFEIEKMKDDVKQEIRNSFAQVSGSLEKNSFAPPPLTSLPKNSFLLHALSLKALSDEFSHLKLLREPIIAPF